MTAPIASGGSESPGGACMGFLVSRVFLRTRSADFWAVDPPLDLVLCSELEGRSSSRRLRSGSRSARKGSRDRNASGAWRCAAVAQLVFRSALTPEHAEGRWTARRAFWKLLRHVM